MFMKTLTSALFTSFDSHFVKFLHSLNAEQCTATKKTQGKETRPSDLVN